MNVSTRLFLRYYRLQIMLAATAVFIVFMIIGANDRPSSKPGHDAVLLLSISLMATMLLPITRSLQNTMFPVTDRQVTYIPFLVWVAILLAGMVGLLCGEAWAIAFWTISAREVGLMWSHFFWSFPLALLPILLYARGVRLNIGFMGLYGFFPMFGTANAPVWGTVPTKLASIYVSMWPLWTLLSVFLIWESQYQVAMLRRLSTVQASNGFAVNTPDLSGPRKPHWSTRIADAFMGLIGAGFVVGYIWVGFDKWSRGELGKRPIEILFYLLLLIPISFAVYSWKRLRASGLGYAKSTGLLILRLAGIGAAIDDLMGVKQGKLVKCATCSGWKLAWEQDCPHGHGDVSKIISIVPRSRTNWRKIMFPIHDPIALLFRFSVPLIMVTLFTISRIVE